MVIQAAVLVADGYFDLELWYPVLRLREAGAEVTMLAPTADETLHSVLGYPVIADRALADAGEGFDLVVVPGGRAGSALAAQPDAVRLVAALAASGARVATVGSGVEVADAAGVEVDASASDADGLPALLAELLAPA